MNKFCFAFAMALMFSFDCSAADVAQKGSNEDVTYSTKASNRWAKVEKHRLEMEKAPQEAEKRRQRIENFHKKGELSRQEIEASIPHWEEMRKSRTDTIK